MYTCIQLQFEILTTTEGKSLCVWTPLWGLSLVNFHCRYTCLQLDYFSTTTYAI